MKSFRLIDRKQAVRDLSAQQFVAVDGPDAGEAMSATLGQSKRSTVNEGLTFSMRRTEVASISRRLSAEIGVGSDATKATGISGAIGGAVEKGEQVVNAVSEQLSQSHSCRPSPERVTSAWT